MSLRNPSSPIQLVFPKSQILICDFFFRPDEIIARVIKVDG
jgi:hypothetical protein